MTLPKDSVGLLMVGLMLHAGGAGLAEAQNPPGATDEAVRFKTEIVVTPERGEAPRALIPAAAVVITDEALATLPIVHPSEVLSFLPGFNVARPQFYAGRPVASARGFFGGGEAEYILLLVDGVPVADVESGLIDWSIVPTASIRRVEAHRGPGASMYGDSAIGGVIQILTDRETGGGRLNLEGGSFRTFSADGSYGRRSRPIGFYVSGAARRTDGGFEHSASRQLVGSGNMDGTVGDFSWRWNATGDDRRRDDPGASTREALLLDPYASDPAFRFDFVDRRSFATAFTLRHATPLWRPQLRVYASGRDEDLIRTILLAPGASDRRQRLLSSVVGGGSLEGEHTFGASRPSELRFGVDLSRDHLDTSYSSGGTGDIIGARNSEAAGHRVRAGAFFSTSWRPVARARLSGAVRWDNVSDDGFGAPVSNDHRAWSPRIGAAVGLNQAGTITAFAQVARAFKVPTLDQLFDPRPYPDFGGGTFTISNRALVPQRATNVEGGVSGGQKSVRWSALVYGMTVDDEIDFDVRTFSYANIGRSRHVGVELEVEGRWWTRVRPSVTYALSRVAEVGLDEQLKNVPRHRVTAAASVDFPWSVSAHARFNRAWGAFLDDANAYAIDGAATIDLRVRRPMGRHAAFVDVINLTNDVYEEYGFTLADFRGRQVPYVYPGAPRAVRAGVTLAF